MTGSKQVSCFVSLMYLAIALSRKLAVLIEFYTVLDRPVKPMLRQYFQIGHNSFISYLSQLLPNNFFSVWQYIKLEVDSALLNKLNKINNQWNKLKDHNLNNFITHYNVSVKVCVLLIKHYAMKAYGGVDV
jgi:hypothetical protein